MKNIFKLSLSLFFNQILGVVSGMMCFMFAFFLAGTGIWAFVLYLAITFSFFVYIQYQAAFKSGFHDSDRRNKKESKAYLLKGAAAGAISAIPVLALIIIYFVALFIGNNALNQVSKLILSFVTMYFSWPLSGIFPNHSNEIVAATILPLVLVPSLGYIAGYKNFDLFDKICLILRIKPKV